MTLEMKLAEERKEGYDEGYAEGVAEQKAKYETEIEQLKAKIAKLQSSEN